MKKFLIIITFIIMCTPLYAQNGGYSQQIGNTINYYDNYGNFLGSTTTSGNSSSTYDKNYNYTGTYYHYPSNNYQPINRGPALYNKKTAILYSINKALEQQNQQNYVNEQNRIIQQQQEIIRQQEQLIKHSSKPLNTNKYIYKPEDQLFYDSASNNIEGVKTLLNKGVDVNKKNNISNSTPLLIACISGNTEIVKLLINNGADVNFIALDGWTPLMGAIKNNYSDIVKILLDNNANIDIKNHSGDTALSLAHTVKNIDIIKMLNNRNTTSKNQFNNSKNISNEMKFNSVNSKTFKAKTAKGQLIIDKLKINSK